MSAGISCQRTLSSVAYLLTLGQFTSSGVILSCAVSSLAVSGLTSGIASIRKRFMMLSTMRSLYVLSSTNLRDVSSSQRIDQWSTDLTARSSKSSHCCSELQARAQRTFSRAIFPSTPYRSAIDLTRSGLNVPLPGQLCLRTLRSC